MLFMVQQNAQFRSVRIKLFMWRMLFESVHTDQNFRCIYIDVEQSMPCMHHAIPICTQFWFYWRNSTSIESIANAFWKQNSQNIFKLKFKKKGFRRCVRFDIHIQSVKIFVLMKEWIFIDVNYEKNFFIQNFSKYFRLKNIFFSSHYII